MAQFDLILPDGMPLVWYLNRHGAALSDRVYGPYFMRHVLTHSGSRWKHFFFGGTPQTLDRLTESARQLNPEINIVGVYSPPFRAWDEADEEENARRIRESGADFVWVALGGGRQERWIVRNLHRHQRGVFLAVGDAFELLAGNRDFAPDWIQRMGLTWFYRLVQEPRRLWPRYFKYNSLFVYYLLREVCGIGEDRQSGTPPSRGSRRIAFIGSRGVPARYSGFETVVEELGKVLAIRGHDVTVYNRSSLYPEHFKQYAGMHIRWFSTIRSKSLDTIVHTFVSLLDALVQRYDIVYLCGVGNAPLSRLLRFLSGARLLINVDGADFRRAKWGPVGRLWLRRSEREAVKVADVVIADNPEIVKRYQASYGYRPRLVSYGTPIGCHFEPTGVLQELGLRRGSYLLFVGRITPENEAHLAIAGYKAAWAIQVKESLSSVRSRPMPEEFPKLVVVGDPGYESDYWQCLHVEAAELPDGAVIFAGGRYGDAYRELSNNALSFLLPARIEATRLVLLDQMGFGSCIIYRDCVATRHVIGEVGLPFGQVSEDSTLLGMVTGSDLERESRQLALRIRQVIADPALRESMGQAAQERARTVYSWEAVADQYEEIFTEMMEGNFNPQ